MTVLGVDVSAYQPPNLPWSAWRAFGVRFAILRASIGIVADYGYPKFREHAQAAGIDVASYHVLLDHDAELAHYDPLRSARVYWEQHQAGDELPLVIGGRALPRSWVDVEALGVTPALLAGFLGEWARITHTAIGIYTSAYFWRLLMGVGHSEFARYPLWVADYRAGAPALPDVWPRAAIHQFRSRAGYLPGYDRDLDVNQLMPAPAPAIPIGPKIGIGAIAPNQAMPLVRRALAAGWHWPVVKSTDNGGLMLDVRRESPATLTIYRHVNSVEDGAQDVVTWTPAQRTAHALVVLKAAVGPLSESERAAVVYWEIVNEADPPGADGWRAYGLYLCELVRQAEARGLRLALPAFNAGTPEWDEMQALVDTGLFGLLKAGGHILTAHEGVFSAGEQLTFGPIPGAPIIADAGPLCWRYRYLYSLLRPRGENVPLVVSEFYAGGGYTDFPAMLTRLARYDREIRRDPEVLAVLPFTVDPDGSWRGSDYTPFYQADELWQYIAAEKDKPNGEKTMPITKAERQALLDQANSLVTTAGTQLAGAQALITKIAAIVPDEAVLYQARALIDLTLRDKAGLPTTDAALAPAGVVKAGTIVPVYAHLVASGAFTNRDVVTADGKSVWGVATALQRI